MRRLALAAGSLVVSILAGSGPSGAASVVTDIEHTMHHIEQQICNANPSPKCKAAKKKSAAPKKPVAAKHVAPKATKSKKSIEPDKPAKPVEPVTPAKPVEAAKPAKPVEPVKPAKRDIPIPMPRPVGVGPPLLEQKIVGPTPAQPIPKPGAKAPPPVVTTPAPPVVVPPPEPSSKPIASEPPLPTQPVQDSSCLTALAATGTSFAPVAQPGTSESCQIPTPVHVFSVSTAAGTVRLPGQPIVNCAFALTFSHWVDDTVQPLAQKSLGSAVAALGTGPGYDCRGRNGDSSAKISEHATGDAVDIVFIRLASKTQVLVKDALNTQSPNFAFLRDLRAAACSEFTTVLGPGTNSAHAEHFHIDLEARRGGYRICE